LLLVYVVWGSTYLGIAKALHGGALPLTMVSGSRFIIAGGLMFLALRLFWKMPNPTLRQWRNLVVMGVTMLVLGNGMVVLAEREVSSGLAATAVASVPLWMALIAPIGWAFGSVWARGLDLPGPFMTAAGQMICGGVLLVLIGLAVGERPTTLPDTGGLLAMAYLCVFGSIVAFTAYVWLLQNVRPALAGSYAYVNPVIAVLLGALLNGERFGWRDLLAMAVILLGVVVLTMARTRKK